MLSTFALVTQALGISKGSEIPNQTYVGDLSLDQLVGIARRKGEGLLASSLKLAVKEILGSCQSMGVTVEGRSAKEMQGLVSSGEFDSQLEEAA
jgi:large subunit ribosomal protein L11